MNRCYPYDGKFKISSPYGKRKGDETTVSSFHRGCDYVGLSTKNIVSCTDGIVETSDYNSVHGNFVYVTVHDGLGILYAHMSKRYAKKGDKVNCKTVLGVEGSTGHSTGSHLHLGVSSQPTYVGAKKNPNDFVDPSLWFGIYNTNREQLIGQEFDGSGLPNGFSLSCGGNQSSAYGDYSNAVTSIGGSQAQYSESSAIFTDSTRYKVVDLQGTLKDVLFGRRYRIIVSLNTGEAFDVSDLRCTFSITKSYQRKQQQAIISIYNLNPNSENAMILEGNRVIIEAGYVGEQYGVIYSGTIIQPYRSKENGTDYKLTLICRDSDQYLTYGLVNGVLRSKASMRQAVDMCATKATYPTQVGNVLNSQMTYPRGKVMFGKSSEYIEQIARSDNAIYYQSDGKVNIISAVPLNEDEAYDIGPETGLIGTPSQNNNGITCKTLLNPNITLYSMIHVDNTKISQAQYSSGDYIRQLDSQGLYKVIQIKYDGDTRGNSWYTELTAVSQEGVLPQMSLGAYFYNG